MYSTMQINSQNQKVDFQTDTSCNLQKLSQNKLPQTKNQQTLNQVKIIEKDRFMIMDEKNNLEKSTYFQNILGLFNEKQEKILKSEQEILEKIKQIFEQNRQNEIKIFQQYLINFEKEHTLISNESIAIQKKIQQINLQKLKWQIEKENLKRLQFQEQDIFQLDVGGKKEGFKFNLKILDIIQGTKLDLKIKTLIREGKDFIDRTPEIFIYVLNTLRNNMQIPTDYKNPEDFQKFKEELEYWGLREVVQRYQLKESQKEKLQKLQEIFSSEPKQVCDQVLQIWKMLGPFDLNQIIYQFHQNNQDTSMLDNLIILKKQQKQIISQEKQEFEFYQGQFKRQINGDEEPVGIQRIEQKYWIFEGLYEKKQNQQSHGFITGRLIKFDLIDIKQCYIYTGQFLNGQKHGKGKKISFQIVDDDDNNKIRILEGNFQRDEFDLNV